MTRKLSLNSGDCEMLCTISGKGVTKGLHFIHGNLDIDLSTIFDGDAQLFDSRHLDTEMRLFLLRVPVKVTNLSKTKFAVCPHGFETVTSDDALGTVVHPTYIEYSTDLRTIAGRLWLSEYNPNRKCHMPVGWVWESNDFRADCAISPNSQTIRYIHAWLSGDLVSSHCLGFVIQRVSEPLTTPCSYSAEDADERVTFTFSQYLSRANRDIPLYHPECIVSMR